MNRDKLRSAVGAMPDVNDIMRYESGEMTAQEIIEFFQGLVDSGMAWKLQGSYARMARDLIEQGLVKQGG